MRATLRLILYPYLSERAVSVDLRGYGIHAEAHAMPRELGMVCMRGWHTYRCIALT